MLIASVNLNKRLGNLKSRNKAHNWMLSGDFGIVVAQEPWRKSSDFNGMFDEFKPIGGNEKVFAWIDSNYEIPSQKLIKEYLQRIELDYVIIYNVYLDAYKQSKRAEQISEIKKCAMHEGNRPILIVGDFNLAPNPKDGLFNGKSSAFNSEIDRKPFRDLLTKCKLNDSTADFSKEKFTIEKCIHGKTSKFRCDLALVSDYLLDDISVSYDHSIRIGGGAFTDHSAIRLNAPVSLPGSLNKTGLLFSTKNEQGNKFENDYGAPCCSYKTAMSRKSESPIARFVHEELSSSLKIASILDYGCGRGVDVGYYLKNGYQCDGYDPHELFGFSILPNKQYDLITIIFVLNVLPDPFQRLQVLEKAAKYMKDDGMMLVVCRSPKEIASEVSKKCWIKHNDGFWSHQGRKTFQKGISREEIIRLAKRVNLVPYDLSESIKYPNNASFLILKNKIH